MNFHINFPAFVDSLQYMGKGLLGIFIVTAVIVLAITLLQKVLSKKEN